MNVAMAEVAHFRPVLRIDKPHLHLVDEGVLAGFLHLALGFGAFIGPDVVFRQGVVDNLHAHLDGHLIAGGAVFSQEVFENKHRHIGADLDLAHEILPDHLAGEDAVDLVVEKVAGWGLGVRHGQIARETGSAADWASTASVSGSTTTTRMEAQSSRSSIRPRLAALLGVTWSKPVSRSSLAPMAMPA
jgi:hypothetical protein